MTTLIERLQEEPRSAEEALDVLKLKVGTPEANFVELVWNALRPPYERDNGKCELMLASLGRPISGAELAAHLEAWRAGTDLNQRIEEWRAQAEANRQAKRAAVLAAWQAKACATHRGAVQFSERGHISTTSAKPAEFQVLPIGLHPDGALS